MKDEGLARTKKSKGKVVKVKTEENFNDTIKRTRSKRGCNGCKAKKAKCDEVRPSCGRCLSQNKVCFYEVKLQFREDFEKQGKSFGREGVWSKNDKASKDSTLDLSLKSRLAYFIKVANPRIQFVNIQYLDLEEKKLIIPKPLISLVPTDVKYAINELSDLSFALNYYISFVSPILNPIGEDTVYYLESSKVIMEKGLDLNLIIQYAHHQEYLFYLLVALGCIYLSKLDSVDRHTWIKNGHNFRNLGLSYITIQLNYLSGESEDPFEELASYNIDLLLSLVFLTMFDIADFCNPRFKYFLIASKKLIESTLLILPQNQFEFSLFKFCLEYLNYQDSVSRTACNAKSFDFLSLLDNTPHFDYNDVSTKTISWMGCDKALVDVITAITDLSIDHKSRPMKDQSYFIEMAKPIFATLDRMKMKYSLDFNSPASDVSFNSSNLPDLTLFSPDSTTFETISSSEKYCLILTDEIKRLSTIIYLECSVLNSSPEDAHILNLVKQVLNLLKYVVIENNFKWCNTLLWSVFIASVEIPPLSLECEPLRYLSLQLLEKLESFSLGNVLTIKTLITSNWKRRDLKDSPIKIGNKGNKKKEQPFNDWEVNVVDESVIISLM